MPVVFTPFQMQKKQTTQTSSKHRARSHFTGPMSSMPLVMPSTLCLRSEKESSDRFPPTNQIKAKQRGPRIGPRIGPQIGPGLRESVTVQLAEHLTKRNTSA